MQKDQNVLEALDPSFTEETRLEATKAMASLLHRIGIISENNVGLLAFVKAPETTCKCRLCLVHGLKSERDNELFKRNNAI